MFCLMHSMNDNDDKNTKHLNNLPITEGQVIQWSLLQFLAVEGIGLVWQLGSDKGSLAK